MGFCNIPPTAPARHVEGGTTSVADQVHSFFSTDLFGIVPPEPPSNIGFEDLFGTMTGFYDQCGVSLALNAHGDRRKAEPGWVGGISIALVDNQLQVRNLTNIVNAQKAAAAQKDAELRKKAEQQKSPY